MARSKPKSGGHFECCAWGLPAGDLKAMELHVTLSNNGAYISRWTKTEVSPVFKFTPPQGADVISD